MMPTMKKDRYRLVADFGYGDKSWQERDLTEEEAIKALNERIGGDFTTIQEALNFSEMDYDYSIELDHPDDEEDWDWMDS